MIRKALLLSMFQRYVAFGISFVSSMILARLLSPSEVGIYTLAAAVVAVATMLRDFGVGDYIIQEQNLTRDKQRAAFTVTLGMAWFIALIMFALAAPLSVQYHEPGLAAVLYVLACNFVLLPFGSVTFAVLTKTMAFGTIFVVQTTTALVHAAVSISLAYGGLSYMSLAWASLCGVGTTIILLAALRPKETLLWPTLSGLRGVARFGGLLTFAHLLSQALRRAPEFLIGSQLGFHSLGLYSRGSGLIDSFNELFTAAINRVAGPMFAAKSREESVLRNAYLNAASMYSIVAVPFFVSLTLFAAPVIHALFGPKWLSATLVAQIFAIGAAIASPYILAGPLLTGTGNASELVRMALIRTPIVLLGVGAGVSYGLEGAAVGLLVAGTISMYFFHASIRKSIGVRWGDIATIYRKSIFLGVICAASASPAFMIYGNNSVSAIICLLAASLTTLIVWALLLRRVHPPLAREIGSAIARAVSYLRKHRAI